MLRSSQPQVDATSAARDSVPARSLRRRSGDSVDTVALKTVTTETVVTETVAQKPLRKPVVTAAATAAPSTSGQPKQASWRTYGPLQVDWANWQSMAGSEVAPTLNGEGQPLYVAVNCSAKKINVTGANGIWKSWVAPKTEFERALVKDRCSAIKS